MFHLSSRYRYAKEVFVFLLAMAALLACLAPAHRHVRNMFASFESMLRETIRSETGLDISFDSASPGIIRNISLYNVTVSGARGGEEIFRANRVAVSLRFFKLLQGDFFGSIRKISIENAKMDLRQAGGSLLSGLALGENKAGGASFADSASEAAGNALKGASSAVQRLFASGTEISARNLSVLAQIAGNEASAHIGRASIGFDGEKLAVDSSLDLSLNLESMGSPFSSLDADLSFAGELSSDLSSGFASLSVESIGLGNVYLSKIELIAGLQDGSLLLASMQEGQPLSLSATLDAKSKSAAASLSCEGLHLFRWISPEEDEGLVALLQGSALSGTASLSFSEEEGLGYQADGSLHFPAGLHGISGGELAFDFSGNLDSAEGFLSILGDDFDAAFSGSFDFAALLPSGLLSVRKFSLPGGALDFSGDFSIESSEKGASLNVPLLTVNRAAFYDVEGRADFSDDGQCEFLLSAQDGTGALAFDGAFSRGHGDFLQLYAALDSLSVENAAAALPRSALSDEVFASLSETLSPFAFTTEVYFSTDFERLVYNIPRLVLASQEEGGLYFLATVAGTESGAEITDIFAYPAGIPIRANIYAGIEGGRGLLFSSDFSVSGIPYSLSGSFADGLLSAYGDYGLSLFFHLPEGGEARGSVLFSDLPVQAGPAVLSLSLDADFERGQDGSWAGNINSFSAREASGLASLGTLLQASGMFDSTGVYLRSLSLSDELSSLSGFASIGMLKDSLSAASRAALDFALTDASGSESIYVAGSVMYGGEGGTLFEGQCSLRRLPLMRFARGQHAGNFISADISISGSPDMMLASVNIPESSLRLGRSDMNASVLAMYEDGDVIVRDGSAAWGNFQASGIHADLSVADLSGTAGAMLSGAFAGHAFSMDLRGSFQGNAIEPSAAGDPAAMADQGGIFGWIGSLRDAADNFSAAFELSGIRWRDMEAERALHCAIERAPGITAAYAGENSEFSGILLDNGTFAASLLGDLPVQFHADGIASGGALDVDIEGIDIDMARFWPILGWPLVEFDGGHVTGGLHIGGHLTDPDFEGILTANDIVVRSPDYFPTPFDPASFLFVANGSEIRAPKFSVTGNGGMLEAEAVFYFNRWIPEQIDLFVRTAQKSRVAAVVNHKYVRARGDIFCDIDLTWVPGLMEVTGDAGFESGHFAILFENIGNEGEGKAPYEVIADLNVHMGRKVEFRWPSGSFPIMRALVQADDIFRYTVDTAAGKYSFKGSGALKGGDFFYFKRSFYLRDGSIAFDENQDHFDPRISLRAEVRERDENGSPVRITMTVDDDPLSSFNPVFSSDPIKNQFEIMEILGQVASADMTTANPWRDLAITGTDLLAQLGVLRPAENFIRDKLSLDFFSIRTLILQNAVFGTSLRGATSSDRWTAGNFLDNTTVYFGKYFGSAFYVDALLQFSYYNADYYQDRIYRNTFFPTVFGNLLFLPEIGLEVDTPFAHIRWGISPVPDNNNVTLSWRFAY